MIRWRDFIFEFEWYVKMNERNVKWDRNVTVNELMYDWEFCQVIGICLYIYYHDNSFMTVIAIEMPKFWG